MSQNGIDLVIELTIIVDVLLSRARCLFLNFFNGKHASFFEKKIESQTPFCLPMHCDLYFLIGEW